eukprot:TRINITY_DN8584_c0_g1_i1.p1 TRINITY_DN8584_c0_g1~~TRINITY_DN8584_c0_g1_i1.p1  ORF type:complete len:574 (-),score=111.35 TRINITY_DN8584_c0_g1_i1:338-2059(-)
MAESASSVSALIEDLRSSVPESRLHAVRKLSEIAKALGSDRTREELIPFLQDCVDDEEIALALAEELGGLLDLLGNVEHGGVLVAPLEALAGMEETAVRDKAVESLNKIANRVPASVVAEEIIPALRRMSFGDWFTSKAAACGMFATVYPKAGQWKGELRSIFQQLCRDETPIVRRAAASQLGALSKKFDKEHLGDLVILLNKLGADEQDSVRLLSIEAAISLGEFFTPEENITKILPMIRSCCGDKSWRVRYMVADHFAEVAKAMGAEATKSELLSSFVKLLKDPEPEVKTAASFKISSFSALLPSDLVIKQILPCLQELSEDPSQHVRAALASVIVGMAGVLPRRDVTEHLMPLILQLLKDESPEVRLNLISKLESMNQSVGLDLLTKSLLPSIMGLAEDKTWRVRLAIIEQMPLVASLLGVKFFDEHFNNLCTSWLGDPVFAVREAATLNLRKFAEAFGLPWAKDNILPKVQMLSEHPNYLFRVMSFHAIQALYPVVTNEIITATFIPILARLANDPVPNIRFNVAKTVQSLSTLMSSSILQESKTIVSRLLKDEDRDVQYYAAQAHGKC